MRSIKAGWQLLFRHPLTVLNHLWPTLLLSMLIIADLSKQLSEHLWVFGYISMADGLERGDLLHTPLFRLLGWMIVSGGLSGIVLGQVAYLIHRYEELGYMPVVKPWKVWRDILPFVLRGVSVNVCWTIVIDLLIVLSFLVLPTFCVLYLIFVLFIIGITMLTIMGRITFPLGERSAMQQLRWNFSKENRQENTGSFAVEIICGMLMILTLLAGSIPALLSMYVGGVAEFTEALGDTTDMPANFGTLRAFSFALATFNALMAYVIFLFPVFFHYGSMKAKR